MPKKKDGRQKFFSIPFSKFFCYNIFNWALSGEKTMREKKENMQLKFWIYHIKLYTTLLYFPWIEYTLATRKLLYYKPLSFQKHLAKVVENKCRHLQNTSEARCYFLEGGKANANLTTIRDDYVKIRKVEQQ